VATEHCGTFEQTTLFYFGDVTIAEQVNVDKKTLVDLNLALVGNG